MRYGLINNKLLYTFFLVKKSDDKKFDLTGLTMRNSSTNSIKKFLF